MGVGAEMAMRQPQRESIQCGIAAQAVTVQVGTQRLLAQLSLVVRPGEVLALAGPNGAGKSTLLRVLAGDLAPTSGVVLLDGRPLTTFRARELALRRAVLPQQTVLQFAFAAREVVTMGRHPHLGRNTPAEADEAIVAAAMLKTETATLAARAYPSLSGGEQSRVSLARVLAQEAPILLLDEPTAALDLRHQQMVLATARELARAGAAVLAIMHDLNLAATYADQVALLAHGQLVAVGRPWQVLTAEILSTVFDYPIMVMPHPTCDCPLIIPAAYNTSALLSSQ